MRVSCEEECRSCERLFGCAKSSEEKLEAVRIVQEDDIEIIVRVIECVDILIEDHISLFFWHAMEVSRECMHTMNTETLVVDKNFLGMTRLGEKMHLHLVLEPCSCVAKISIIIVVIAYDSKVSERLESVKEFLCHLHEVLK